MLILDGQTVAKFIPLSDFCEATGFMADDILAELANKGISASRMGNNYYLNANIVSALFPQDFFTNIVDSSSILSTPLDKKSYSELSSPPEEEVRKMGKATISYVEAKKKHYLVQQRIYTHGSDKATRRSKYFATREEAEALAAEWNSEHQELAVLYNASGLTEERINRNTPFLEFVNFYYFHSGYCDCGDRTLSCYADCIRLISEELRMLNKTSITIGEINDTVCNTVLKRLSKSAAKSTVDKCKMVFKRTLKYAHAKNYIAGNDFTTLITAPKTDNKPEKRQPYSEEELKQLIQCSADNPFMSAVINLEASTGMRPQELRALRWEDIDFNNKTVCINGAAKICYKDPINRKGKHEEIGTTKSASGIRTIPLTDSALAAIKAWRAEADKDAFGKDSRFVFFDAGGNFISEEALNCRWKRFLKRHSLDGKGYCLYRFRHYYCTKLLMADIPPAKVQLLMGDSTQAVVMNIYNGMKSDNIVDEMRDTINNIFPSQQPVATALSTA